MIALFLAALIYGMSAFSFTQSVGMNEHLDHSGPAGDCAFLDTQLKALGIRWVRSSGTILANSKYRACLQVLNNYDGPNAVRYDLLFAQNTPAAQVVADVGPLWGVSYFEAPNELDIAGLLTWPLLDIAETRELTTAAAHWGSISVVAPSTVFADPVSVLLGSYGFGNTHDYFGSRPPETAGYGGDVYHNGTAYGSLAYALAAALRAAPGKPVIATETGYATDPGKLTEYTQAAYLERLLPAHAAAGVPRTFLYDMVDDNENFGLYHADGTPKLAVAGISGMMSLLAETKDVKSCSLNATIVASAPVRSYLFCKSNGHKLIALVNPQPIQDPNSYAQILVTPIQASIALPAPISSPMLYTQDATFHWSGTSVADFTKLDVTDRMMFADIPPQ
jgi:hypothetical protein